MVALEIIVVVLLVLVNGFLAMAELAIVSSRRSRLEQLAAQGYSGARAALSLADDPGRFLVRMFTKVATVFMKAVTAEQSCKALSLRLSGTPPRGAVYPTGV